MSATDGDREGAVEVRISPDGYDVAIRNADSRTHPWRVSNGGRYMDRDVADWLPLATAGARP